MIKFKLCKWDTHKQEEEEEKKVNCNKHLFDL